MSSSEQTVREGVVTGGEGGRVVSGSAKITSYARPPLDFSSPRISVTANSQLNYSKILNTA